MDFRDFKNMHELVKETVDRQSNDTAYRWYVATGQADSVSWNEFYDQLRTAAKSLIALGVEKDTKTTILSYTCYRWVLSDLAAIIIGGVSVGIYQSLLPDDCKYIINHCDAVVIFAQDELQLEKLMKIRAEIPEIRKVVLFDGTCPDDDWVISYEQFLELGKDISDEELEKRIEAVTSSDNAGIVYTSGTTGVPKGAVLTHENFTFTAQSVAGSVVYHKGDHVFLFLPLAHVFARTCAYTSILAGSTTTFNRNMDTLVDDLKASRPHWFASVPRIYEKVYSKVISGAEAKGGLTLKIFRWAMNVGLEVGECKLNKKPIPALLGLKHKLATKLVFRKIQEALGGRVRWCISGAAPLNPDIGKFFHAAGILIVEGIGMTENTSFTNLNRYDNHRYGWVGPTGPGIEQRIADDGEIMFRGRNIMKEYYKMPEETAKTITEDGWQYTGDLGEIDDEGFLRVTGRKKELIITAGGKNVAPAAIEGAIATSKYIGQVCVIGDKRKFLTALVTPDPDNVPDYAKENNIPFESMADLIKNEQIIKLMESEVAEKNKSFASYETVKKVTLVPEFTIENGLLTPTLKIKKNIALDQYSQEIDEMYPRE